MSAAKNCKAAMIAPHAESNQHNTLIDERSFVDSHVHREDDDASQLVVLD
jgi:hypothetical protein